MDFKNLPDKIGDLAEQGGDLIENAAEAIKDKVLDIVPNSFKDKAEALVDKATEMATGAVGKAADKLSNK